MGYIIALATAHGLLGAMSCCIGFMVVLNAGEKLEQPTVKNFCISQAVAMMIIFVSANHSSTETLNYAVAILASIVMYIVILKTSTFFRK